MVCANGKKQRWSSNNQLDRIMKTPKYHRIQQSNQLKAKYWIHFRTISILSTWSSENLSEWEDIDPELSVSAGLLSDDFHRHSRLRLSIMKFSNAASDYLPTGMTPSMHHWKSGHIRFEPHCLKDKWYLHIQIWEKVLINPNKWGWFVLRKSELLNNAKENSKGAQKINLKCRTKNGTFC